MIDPESVVGQQLVTALVEIGWKPPKTRDADVISLILAGELLTLDQAADVAECSDEKIRRACELAASTNNPIGVKLAGRWLVGKARLLDDLEGGKLDRRGGLDARRRAEERAKKYEGWARPQEALVRARPQQASC
jgi:hypothetical protein